MKVAVKTRVDSQLALSHAELSQVAVDGEGRRPVQPDPCQVTVHQDGGHILWFWREGSKGRGGAFGHSGPQEERMNALLVPSLCVVTVVQSEAALPMLLKQAALS